MSEAVVEPLSSPIPGLAFVGELRTVDGYREVHMTGADGDRVVVARLPVDRDGDPRLAAGG